MYYLPLENMMLKYRSTGGETADVGDLVRTIIVDSTVVCRLKRSSVISADNIREGDVIVGLASFGQATYEETYNSGMGSNGLTSARHDTFEHSYASLYKESYDGAIPPVVVYCGKRKLTDKVSVQWRDKTYNTDIGKLLLISYPNIFPVIQRYYVHTGPMYMPSFTVQVVVKPKYFILLITCIL